MHHDGTSEYESHSQPVLRTRLQAHCGPNGQCVPPHGVVPVLWQPSFQPIDCLSCRPQGCTKGTLTVAKVACCKQVHSDDMTSMVSCRRLERSAATEAGILGLQPQQKGVGTNTATTEGCGHKHGHNRRVWAQTRPCTLVSTKTIDSNLSQAYSSG
jgi:hypothetical protein